MSNSPVIAFLNKMTDLILLNIIWLISCIPIVTIGAATTAMYYVCIISIRQGDGYVIKRYIASFKQNFRQSTIIWLIMLLITAVFGLDIFFWNQVHTGFGKVMLCVSMALWLLVGVIGLYVFPVLSKLEGTLISTIKNATAFAIGYFPYTIALILLTVGFIWLNLTSLEMNAISIFIGFALLAYLKSFFVYKVMMNHIDESFDDFLDPTDE